MHRGITNKVARNGSAIIPSNCRAKGSRNVNQPLLPQVAHLRRETGAVFPGKEDSLIKDGKEGIAKTFKRFNNAGFNFLPTTEFVCPVRRSSLQSQVGKRQQRIFFGKRVAVRGIQKIFFPVGEKETKSMIASAE